MKTPFLSFFLTIVAIVTYSPKIDFAGYSVPHPSVNKMNLRVQTRKHEDESENTTATECLKQGLKDITTMCDHILVTFEKELASYKEAHPDAEPMET